MDARRPVVDLVFHVKLGEAFLPVASQSNSLRREHCDAPTGAGRIDSSVSGRLGRQGYTPVRNPCTPSSGRLATGIETRSSGRLVQLVRPAARLPAPFDHVPARPGGGPTPLPSHRVGRRHAHDAALRDNPAVGEQAGAIACGLTQPRGHTLERRSADRRRRHRQVDVSVRVSSLNGCRSAESSVRWSRHHRPRVQGLEPTDGHIPGPRTRWPRREASAGPWERRSVLIRVRDSIAPSKAMSWVEYDDLAQAAGAGGRRPRRDRRGRRRDRGCLNR